MLVGKLEDVMSDSPDAGWTRSEDLHTPTEPQSFAGRHASPPTPAQRRLGSRLGLGIMVLALLVIILLDHYGILH